MFFGYAPGGGTPDTTIPCWVMFWLRFGDILGLKRYCWTQVLSVLLVSEDIICCNRSRLPCRQRNAPGFRTVLSPKTYYHISHWAFSLSLAIYRQSVITWMKTNKMSLTSFIPFRMKQRKQYFFKKLKKGFNSYLLYRTTQTQLSTLLIRWRMKHRTSFLSVKYTLICFVVRHQLVFDYSFANETKKTTLFF